MHIIKIKLIDLNLENKLLTKFWEREGKELVRGLKDLEIVGLKLTGYVAYRSIRVK